MKKILQGLLPLAVMAVFLILVAMSLDASSPDFVSERGMVSWQDDYEKMYTLDYTTETVIKVEADFLFMPTPAEARAEDLNTDCEDEIFSLISLVNPELAEEIEDMDLEIREEIHESSVSTGDVYRYSGLRAEGETVIVPDSSTPEKHEISLSMYQDKTFENEYDRMEDIGKERPGYFEKLWYNITHIGEFFEHTMGND